MLNRVIAIELIRIMTTGRTAPLLCACVDHDARQAGEFVVKVLGAPTGANRALFELIGSRLASHFGILVPDPAVVQLEQDFVDVLSEHLPERASSLQDSVGPNFGSRVLSPMATWLVDRIIPDAMFRDAANIFAFDALIQNPDRRAENPNLFTQGDNIYAYDHETSFSFLMALGKSAEPWNLEREGYLDRHVFYSRLKSKEIDLRDFADRLNDLSPRALATMREEIPAEWMHTDLERIETHLLDVRKNSGKFVEQVKRRLA